MREAILQHTKHRTRVSKEMSGKVQSGMRGKTYVCAAVCLKCDSVYRRPGIDSERAKRSALNPFVETSDGEGELTSEEEGHSQNQQNVGKD